MSILVRHYLRKELQELSGPRLYFLARAHGAVIPPHSVVERKHLIRCILAAQKKARPRLCTWPGCKLDLNTSHPLARYCSSHKLAALRESNRVSSKRYADGRRAVREAHRQEFKRSSSRSSQGDGQA